MTSRGLRARAAVAVACVALAAVTAPAGAARTAATPSPRALATSGACAPSGVKGVTVTQLLELQISYTTLVARYYEPVDPLRLARGAHAGVVAYLRGCGIVDRVPYAAPRRAADASERIDADVVRTLATLGARIDPDALVDAAIGGELASLHDPYTLLFRPTAYHGFTTFLAGDRFGGVGLVLDASKRLPRIAEILPGSPAASVDIHAGDVIATIDGASVAGFAPDRLRELLRGKPGTVVRLGLERDGAPLPEAVAVTRAVLHDPQTIVHRFGDVGYVQLTRFGDGAAADVAAALATLRGEGATKYVLDLRENGGGYGEAATAVASLFVRTGTIFTTRARGVAPVVSRATGTSTWSDPLVVLVNHDTASASEIVASALQEHGVATVVGTRTFGKGVVQEVFPLPDGAAMKVTTARYTTSTGRDIEHLGVTPDVVVAEPAGAASLGIPGHDAQLDAALRLLTAAAPSGTAAPASTAMPSSNPAPSAVSTSPAATSVPTATAP